MRLRPALGVLVALIALIASISGALPRASAAAETAAEPVAVMQGLDKITARASRFDAPVAQVVNFGALSIVVRDCEKSAPEEQPENAAFVEITGNRPGEGKLPLVSGWMFSSSPALSALEHPVYDVNLLECKGALRLPRPAAPPPAKLPGQSPRNAPRSRSG